MSSETQHFYSFGEFRLDVKEKQLRRNGEILPLTPKAYEVLVLLVENSGHLIPKEVFFEKVWANSFVEENNLADNVSTLRKVLGDDPRKPAFIETIPRRGYRFIGQVNGTREDSVMLVAKENILPARSTKRSVVIASLAILALGLASLFLRGDTAPSAVATPEHAVRSIAVLPFKPLVVNSADDYLEFGLADALITKLGNVKDLSVRPTTAVLQYNDRAVSPREVGHEQRVDAVVAGQFQKFEDQIRLTVQLVRTSDGAVVWAQTFDDHLTNIFAVQDSISTEVARALRVQLSGEERQRIAKRDTASLKAYEHYLKGRYSFSKWTLEGVNQAIDYYQLAIEADPNYAAPVAGLSKCYHVLGTHYLSAQEMFPKAKHFAQKAVEMDRTLAEAWSSLGLAKFNEWDWSGAEKDLKRSVEVNVNYAEGYEIRAHILMLFERMEDAINEMKEAREIDPLSPSIVGGLGNILYTARRYDEAIEQYRTALELYPNRPEVHTGLALAYARRTLHAEALAEIEKAVTLSGQKDKPSLDVALIYALTGKSGEARQMIAKIEALTISRTKGASSTHVVAPQSEYFPPLGLARVYAALGNVDKAFQWLEKAYQEHTGSLALIKVSPDYDALRSDPRYSDLLHRMGL